MKAVTHASCMPKTHPKPHCGAAGFLSCTDLSTARTTRLFRLCCGLDLESFTQNYRRQRPQASLRSMQHLTHMYRLLNVGYASASTWDRFFSCTTAKNVGTPPSLSGNRVGMNPCWGCHGLAVHTHPWLGFHATLFAALPSVLLPWAWQVRMFLRTSRMATARNPTP